VHSVQGMYLKTPTHLIIWSRRS